MAVLQSYRYFQPIDSRFRYVDAATRQGCTAFALLYSGVIPVAPEEPTEEVLERLLLRHGSETRPHAREFRPVAAGDVFDLSGRGLWQVLPIGFRALKQAEVETGAAN